MRQSQMRRKANMSPQSRSGVTSVNYWWQCGNNGAPVDVELQRSKGKGNGKGGREGGRKPHNTARGGDATRIKTAFQRRSLLQRSPRRKRSFLRISFLVFARIVNLLIIVLFQSETIIAARLYLFLRIRNDNGLGLRGKRDSAQYLIL